MCKWNVLTVALVLAVATGAACSESAVSPTSPSSASGSSAVTAERLTGTWRLTTLQAEGQALQLVPSNATYDLTFADGRLSTRADCNICNGAFTVSGQTLTAGPILACTRAACQTMDFEQAYTRILAGDSTAVVSGNTLLLTSPRGRLTFQR